MTTSYEIHQCPNCGLRYPLTEGHPFGTRCPSCLGDTEVVLTRRIAHEVETVYPPPSFRLEGLLDNIRSAWNVGSIFRSADGFGLSHLHLCGITPTPENESVAKTSLGSEKTVSWTYHKNAIVAARKLKSKGYQLFALEDDARAVSIHHPSTALRSTQEVLLIAGNEVTGVDPELLEMCDEIIFIPMWGRKKSFNVAVAFSIAAFTLSTSSE
ncbi:MAG: RNA methyltransferase [Chloroflexi bacterium]|nr:RNA methyltransferase [Chloroflexota bacterium]